MFAYMLRCMIRMGRIPILVNLLSENTMYKERMKERERESVCERERDVN